jgi:hypothetical protein
MYENRIMKSVKIVLKGEKVNKKSNGGGTFSQSTLCACMEIPQ